MAFRLYSPLQLVCTSARNSLNESDIISALIYVLIYVLLKNQGSSPKTHLPQLPALTTYEHRC